MGDEKRDDAMPRRPDRLGHHFRVALADEAGGDKLAHLILHMPIGNPAL